MTNKEFIMFAKATFENVEPRFYSFLINCVCDIEMLYFMKGEENLHHNEVVIAVEKF